ncbi:DUF3592 domain-containing protein [Myxococcota bacterium]|nr:DUF3592 domain-containing protein [Myxococcota bacterium]
MDLSLVPPPPRYPSKRARKLVHGYQGGQLVFLIVGGIFLFIGSIFTLVFTWGLPMDLAIAVSSRPVTGRVVSSELNTSVAINEEHPTTVRVRYMLDGEVIEDELDTMSPGLYELEPGSRIDLEVSTWSPRWSRLKGSTRSAFGWGATFVVIFPLIGAALTYAGVRANRREIRAFRDGVATLGKVTIIGPDLSTRINGRHPTKLTWAFETPDGVKRTGSLSALDESLFGGLYPNDPVAVLYDPDNPEVNTLWVD